MFLFIHFSHSWIQVETLLQAGLSSHPFHSLPHDPKLAVTLAILGAPSVTLQAPVERPRPFSEIRCLRLCVYVMSSSVPIRVGSHSFFSLHTDPWLVKFVSVSNSSDKLIYYYFKFWPWTKLMSSNIHCCFYNRPVIVFFFNHLMLLPVEFRGEISVQMSAGYKSLWCIGLFYCHKAVINECNKINSTFLALP